MKAYGWFFVVTFAVIGIFVFSGVGLAQAKKATPSPTPAKGETQGVLNMTIGLVDINKIFDSHPNTQKAAEIEKKVVEELQKRQQELNERGKGKTKEEVDQLEKEMNAEWAPVRDEMLKERQALLDARYADVIAAIKKVAEELKLTLVIRSELRIPVSQKELLEMPLVFYGGLDITDKVIEAMKGVLGNKAGQ